MQSKSADKQRKHTKKGGQPDELCSAVEGPLVTKSTRVPSSLTDGVLHEMTWQCEKNFHECSQNAQRSLTEVVLQGFNIKGGKSALRMYSHLNSPVM